MKVKKRAVKVKWTKKVNKNKGYKKNREKNQVSVKLKELRRSSKMVEKIKNSPTNEAKAGTKRTLKELTARLLWTPPR